MTILRKAYIWNTLSTATYAIMTFLMTLMTIRLLGAEAGGVFSIAISSARMLQSLGEVGMRSYQATDATGQFDAGEYISSRIITSSVMIVAFGIYAWFMHFETEKLIVYLLFCGVKLFEVFSDVMEGIAHRKNRLDIAARSTFLRTVSIMAGFIGVLLASRSLISASFFAFIMSALGFFLWAWPSARRFERISISTNYRRVGKLLLQCLPLFLGAATGAYVGGAPKVAIELNMSDLEQAQFAVIFMPVTVIDLASSFIFNPQLNTMAGYFVSNEKQSFRKLIRTMSSVVVGLTLIALGGTYFLGVPVLGWIYQMDLSNQKGALLLVVFSGMFSAFGSLLSQTLTVIRRQNSILAGYLFVAVITAIVSNPLVKNFGMMGSVLLYFSSRVLLVLFLAFFYIDYMKKLEHE